MQSVPPSREDPRGVPSGATRGCHQYHSGRPLSRQPYKAGGQTLTKRLCLPCTVSHSKLRPVRGFPFPRDCDILGSATKVGGSPRALGHLGGMAQARPPNCSAQGGRATRGRPYGRIGGPEPYLRDDSPIREGGWSDCIKRPRKTAPSVRCPGTGRIRCRCRGAQRFGDEVLTVGYPETAEAAMVFATERAGQW